MVSDLLSNHSPIGRPVGELDAMLGRADEGRGIGHGYYDDWDRVWCLGMEPTSTCPGTLRVRIDAVGTVIEARVIAD